MNNLNIISKIDKIKKYGILYIVPTPIGNLSDITLRALKILQQVDIIAVENIKHTQILLTHYNINNNVIKIHQKNEDQKSKQIITQIKNGKNIALVSDAGTPLINDPGFILVNDCYNNNIRVIPLPGACALITALSASGIPSNRFCYEGFLPTKKKLRCTLLKNLQREIRTIIFYESPHRILTSMEDIVTEIGSQRDIVIAREISKYWESIYRGTAHEILLWLKNDINNCKGEIVIIINGYKTILKNILSTHIIKTFKILYKEFSLKKSVLLTSEIHNVKKNILYKYAVNHFK